MSEYLVGTESFLNSESYGYSLDPRTDSPTNIVSGLFRRIRWLESGREANIERNLILVFMVGTIVIGYGVTLMVLDAIAS